jgi:uncharacterized protein YecE (DUF72 family)
MKIFIGTSGWQYYHWYEKFYPKDLKPKDFLSFYSKKFNCVEINASFYRFIKKETFEKWKEQVPKNFLFAVKLNRLFTHLRKLKLKKEDKKILESFFDSVKALGKNLGPILIQLPPSFKDEKTLQNFVKILKETSKKFFKKVLFALEIRNKNLLNKKIFDFLKKEKIIFVISDSPKWETVFLKTTPEIYVRFHGKPKLFASPYGKENLKVLSKEILKLRPKTFFAFFNNDAEGHAIDDAILLKKILEK